MLSQLFLELTLYQERMYRKSKAKFREYLKEKAIKSNLSYNITPDSILSKNVIIGDINNAKYVFGAHYDTPPRMPAFLMKNVLFFNIVFLVFIVAVIIIFGQLKIHPLIIIFTVILIILYPIGFFSVANKYNYNDNTSGVLLLLFLMTKLDNTNVAYIFFDNEEKGLIGSLQLLSYLKKSKAGMFTKKFFIFDCIGRGRHFRACNFGNDKLSNDFKEIFEKFEFKDYNIEVKKGGALEMSDHIVFRQYSHVGIMCYKKTGEKYSMSGIHSHKDKNIDLKNIYVLSKTIEEIVK